MTRKFDYSDKCITPEEFIEKIRPGQRIFFSSGPATPARSVQAIIEGDSKTLLDLELIQLITMNDRLSQGSVDTRYRLKTFSVGESISKRIQQGEVDFIPANLIEIPYLFSTGAVGVDIAVITTSPPDERGYLNLGIAVDVANIVIRQASLVVAEINPFMPVTYGETSIHINQVDCVIESDIPLPERPRKQFDKIQEKIGWHISNLIDDGSTIALHAGRAFDAIASNLTGKRNLGVFTNVISDWVIELIESGAVSFERTRYRGGQVTTSYCYGSRELYDYVDRNPMIEFHSISRLANPFHISRISNLTGIMNVKRIDISGENVIFHSGDNLLTGYESKFNFAFGAAFSRNGKSIISLKSTDPDGNSNIVIMHEEEHDKARATLGVARYVVTEYGVADLLGKSIRERVLAMIDIAHPDHRKNLLAEAKERGYVYRDQIYLFESAKNYPVNYETVKSFGDLTAKFRPVKPSDEEMMRRFIYGFSDEDRYLRYFIRIPSMPHKDMQEYVNIDYDSAISLIGLVQKDRIEKIIAEARYTFVKKTKSYEVAIAVEEEYRNRGIGTFLINCLIAIASSKGLPELRATVLKENKRMLRVFQKTSVEPKVKVERDQISIIYPLKKLR
ncbi:MAG TPA: GNAT family N-acetyltransferase [Spirochaetota bacterium]|nr:GNAT family N-acetyltransferase [Spirochaetota bacterium]HPI88634.1 GNAT family N-acetyltransferase [Spirochaetota bacterium]HPR49600.1 GNAT family N-acetyltransferase [Spirochaetota bacterium]